MSMRQINLRNDQRYQSDQDTNCTVRTDAYSSGHVKRQPHHHRPEDNVHCVQNRIGFETSESFELIYLLCEVFIG